MICLPRSQVDVKKIKEDLTHTLVTYAGKRRRVKFYDLERKRVWVPRYYALKGPYKKLVKPMLTGDPPRQKEGLEINGKLLQTVRRPQVKVFDAAMRFLREDGGTIVVQPCGAGKTNVAIALSVHTGLKTLVLCHNMTLMDQWAERLRTFVKGGIRIGRIKQSQCDTEDMDVVVASLQSLHSRDYPEEALQYGLVIVDEVHHLAAQTFAWVLKKLKYKWSLGLTATLERRDGLVQVVCQLVGKPCIRLVQPGHQQTFDTKTLTLVSPRRPDVQANILHFDKGRRRERTYRNGKVAYSSMVTWLTQDSLRNHFILKAVELMRQRGRQGLLLSARVSHLEELHPLIPDSEIFTGQLKTEPMEEGTEKEFKKFLTLSTYQQFSEAMDFCGNFIILATPMSSIEQSVGRILRGKLSHQTRQEMLAVGSTIREIVGIGGLTCMCLDYLYQPLRPVCIDIYDTFSVFFYMAKKRFRFYSKAGFELQHIDYERFRSC